MNKRTLQDLPEFYSILGFVDSIFRALNMGFLIYHMEDLAEPASLRLIYANGEASRSTGADLQNMVGRRIFNAFPNLESTEVPGVFADVVNRKESRFPMPHDCVGVLFEKI